MTIAEKYQRERERIELNRVLDWSTMATQHKVLGEKLNPLTVQTWFDLLAVKSPVLYNKTPTPEGVVDYIWRNSPKRTTNKLLRFFRLLWVEIKVARAFGRLDLEMMRVLVNHADMALEEYPSDNQEPSQRKSNTMPGISGPASMVDEIASRYSMHPSEVLKMPLRQAFALQRIIRTTTIPGYQLTEPESLKKIKREFLTELNNGTQRN